MLESMRKEKNEGRKKSELECNFSVTLLLFAHAVVPVSTTLMYACVASLNPQKVWKCLGTGFQCCFGLSPGRLARVSCSNQVAFHLSLYICDVHLNTSTQCGISKRELFSQRYGCTAWRSRCSAQKYILQHAGTVVTSSPLFVFERMTHI